MQPVRCVERTDKQSLSEWNPAPSFPCHPVVVPSSLAGYYTVHEYLIRSKLESIIGECQMRPSQVHKRAKGAMVSWDGQGIY